MSSPSTSDPRADVDQARARHQRDQLSLERSSHRWILVVAIAVMAFSFLLSVPNAETVSVPWLNASLPGVCSTRRILGIECPGCGLTRSFICIAHGDWARARQFNAVGILFFILIAGQIPYRLWQLWRVRTGRGSYDFGIWGMVPLMVVAGLLILQWMFKLLFPAV
jgi:hypothetical protein